MTDTLLKESLIRLKQDSKFSDVELVIGETTLRLHRCVLASRSIKFKMMFDSQLEEGKSHVVRFDTEKPSLVIKLINWIYSSEIEFPEEDCDIFELIVLADEHFLEDLRRKCEDELLYRLDGENCIDILVGAYRHKSLFSDNFIETCINTLIEEFDVTLESFGNEEIEKKLFGNCSYNE